MKKAKLSIFMLLAVLVTVHAQNEGNWREMKNNGSTFNEIKSAMTGKFEGKSTNPKRENYSKEYKQYKRWESYWKLHVLENGEFPSTSFLKGVKNEVQLRAQNSNRVSGNWEYLGPQTFPQSIAPGYPGMGRVNCVSFSPWTTDPNNIFVGTPAGGLWESTDGGDSWTPLTDDMPYNGVSDILVDWYTESGLMYMATGDADGAHTPSTGVLKSTDWGQTWTETAFQADPDEELYIYALSAPYHNAGDTVYAATSIGLYYTHDGGDTWDYVDHQEAEEKCYDVTASPYHEEVYAALVNSNNEDHTLIWRIQSNATLSIGTDNYYLYGRVKLFALDNARDFTSDYYFLTSVDEEGTGFYHYEEYDNVVGYDYSTSAGFTSLGNYGYSSQGGYNMDIAVNPLDNNEIIIGGVHGWISYDGGSSWEKYLDGYWEQGDPNFYIHSDHHDIKYINGTSTLFTANDGGLHKINTANDNHEDLSEGLHITQYYGIGGAPYNVARLVGGAQDNDAFYFNGTVFKDQNNNTDGIDGMVNFEDDNVMYTSSQEGMLIGTVDGFTSTEDISPCANAEFVWPIAMNLQNAYTIYAGCTDILKSEDAGGTWFEITNGESAGGYYEEIAVAPSDSNYIYASGTDGVTGEPFLIATDDDGSTWYNVTIPGFGGKMITGIAVAPDKPENVIITFSGYHPGEKVFMSDDMGDTWSNISGTLPNMPIHCVVAQTGANGDVYIGTSTGVYYINNDLTDWSEYTSELPAVQVNDLEINYSSEKLRAATYGRGIWDSGLVNGGTTNPTSITEMDSYNFDAFPSPASDQITISSLTTIEKVTIYNLIGGVVFTNYSVDADQLNVKVANWKKGVYFITVDNGTEIVTKKIEVVR